jgi:hypothetical protein
MEASEIAALAERLAPLIIAGMVAAGQPTPAPLPRMTPEQFACVVDRCPAVIRRHIRCKSSKLPPSDVDGPPYRIHPRALARWGVTSEIALHRLSEYNARGKPSPQATPRPSGA